MNNMFLNIKNWWDNTCFINHNYEWIEWGNRYMKYKCKICSQTKVEYY